MTFNLFEKKPQSPFGLTWQTDKRHISIDWNPIHMFYTDLQEQDWKLNPVLKGFLETQEKEFDELFDISL